MGEEEAAKLEITAAFQIARQTLVEKETKPTSTTTTTETTTEMDRDVDMTRREIADLKKRMAENESEINELLEELKYQSEDLYEEEEEVVAAAAEAEEGMEDGSKCETNGGIGTCYINIDMEDVSR